MILRRLRVGAGRSTASLAAAVGVTPGYVRHVEGRTRPLPLARAKAWATALGLSEHAVIVAGLLDAAGLTQTQAAVALLEIDNHV